MGLSLPVLGVPGVLDSGGDPNVITMTVTTTSSPQTVSLTRITPTGADALVSWGDGATSTITDGNTGATAHEYATAGAYKLTLTGFSYVTYFNVASQPLSGDVGSWVLPNALTYISLFGTSFTGNVGGWVLPSTLEQMAFTSVSGITGDVSGWVLPSVIINMYFANTGITGDVSAWVLPANQQLLRLDGTTCSGTPDISNNTAIRTYYMNDCALTQANVDAIIDSVYARRAAFTYATPTLRLHGTNAAPSATPQVDTYIPTLEGLGWTVNVST
jgi:hypothetical protein